MRMPKSTASCLSCLRAFLCSIFGFNWACFFFCSFSFFSRFFLVIPPLLVPFYYNSTVSIAFLKRSLTRECAYNTVLCLVALPLFFFLISAVLLVFFLSLLLFFFSFPFFVRRERDRANVNEQNGKLYLFSFLFFFVVFELIAINGSAKTYSPCCFPFSFPLFLFLLNF